MKGNRAKPKPLLAQFKGSDRARSIIKANSPAPFSADRVSMTALSRSPASDDEIDTISSRSNTPWHSTPQIDSADRSSYYDSQGTMTPRSPRSHRESPSDADDEY